MRLNLLNYALNQATPTKQQATEKTERASTILILQQS